MNEKFFDLKKEKQDRMINAALKIFAKNGYRHASTDDIVVEAGISKGLLFHYFGSKIGLYAFIYDYCVRFTTLEFKSTIPEDENDYFKIMKGIESAKYGFLRTYPYMQMFIDSSQREDAEEAINITAPMREELGAAYDALLNQVDLSKFKSNVDPASIHSIIGYTLRGMMEEQLQANVFNADAYHNDAIKYINMLETMSY